MKLYPVFLLMAFVTVLIPGPGVVMTLTNSLRYGFRGTFGGILGIAFGAFVVAAISSTSLGVILATSALAFTVLKFIGAAYLIYLGIKFWRSPPFRFADQPALLNADLTKEERERMQAKVEKLHRAWTKDRDYLAPPTVGTLADLDPALLVTPPKGFEIGYVPIATRQELEAAPSAKQANR